MYLKKLSYFISTIKNSFIVFHAIQTTKFMFKWDYSYNFMKIFHKKKNRKEKFCYV